MIGAMITMYSAVANRKREIGTLRALGFSKAAIMTSFMLEAILLALLGGVLGALGSLAMGFARFSMINMQSWSEIVFTFEPTPAIVIGALVFGAVDGPARRLLPRRPRRPLALGQGAQGLTLSSSLPCGGSGRGSPRNLARRRSESEQISGAESLARNPSAESLARNL